MFGWSGKSTNPVQVQILNLPPSLRKVLYFGMHMWCLDSGSDAALSLIAEELDHLWKVGITVGTWMAEDLKRSKGLIRMPDATSATLKVAVGIIAVLFAMVTEGIFDKLIILDLGDEIMTLSACADDEEVVTEEGINLHPSLLDFLKDLDCFDCED